MLDPKKIFRIGIDKWYLKNFNLKYPEHLKKLDFITDGSLVEGIEIGESEFFLKNYTKLTPEGELLPEVTILVFNPNTILDGNNICNSREGRTIDALERIKQKLKLKDIELDYSEALVETVEIQQNFNVEFKNMEKLLDLIFSIASKYKSKKTFGDSSKKHLIDHRPSESYWWIERGNIRRAYDKTAEINQTTNLNIDLPITRIEKKPTPYRFKKLYESNGIRPTLMQVLNHMDLIDEMFISFWRDALGKTFKYLENGYLKELERGYLRFKDIQKTARTRGEKVQRGVYKWLDENYEIYDSHYLIEIIKKYDCKHVGRETKIIHKIFKNDCLKQIEYLSNFFAPLIPNNGERKEE